ncbi:alpha/beta hydrolase, partial [bacterium]|nr:alpha/beta hydrolase [bacterium]MBU1024385.1 alpha/beta hydrolase [bacterium]
MFLNVNDAEFYVEETGQGKTVVLVHGNMQDIHTWDEQVETLSFGYHTVVYDIRGTGKSSRLPNMPFSHVADLEGIFNSLGITDAYLIGVSLGGLLATNFAQKHPHRISGLVLVSSDLVGGPVSPDYVRFLASLKLAIRTGGIEKAEQRYLNSPLLKAPMSKPKVAAKIKHMLEGYHWELFLENAPNGLMKPISRLELPEIKAPTEVIYGEKDIENF